MNIIDFFFLYPHQSLVFLFFVFLFPYSYSLPATLEHLHHEPHVTKLYTIYVPRATTCIFVHTYRIKTIELFL